MCVYKHRTIIFFWLILTWLSIKPPQILPTHGLFICCLHTASKNVVGIYLADRPMVTFFRPLPACFYAEPRFETQADPSAGRSLQYSLGYYPREARPSLLTWQSTNLKLSLQTQLRSFHAHTMILKGRGQEYFLPFYRRENYFI